MSQREREKYTHKNVHNGHNVIVLHNVLDSLLSRRPQSSQILLHSPFYTQLCSLRRTRGRTHLDLQIRDGEAVFFPAVFNSQQESPEATRLSLLFVLLLPPRSPAPLGPVRLTLLHRHTSDGEPLLA